MKQVLSALSDPTVATPIWGALGGLTTAIVRKRRSIMQLLVSMVLAALFAHWFAIALVDFFSLPQQSLAGVGAVLGITSYEIARVLVSGEWLVWIRLMVAYRRTGKK